MKKKFLLPLSLFLLIPMTSCDTTKKDNGKDIIDDNEDDGTIKTADYQKSTFKTKRFSINPFNPQPSDYVLGSELLKDFEHSDINFYQFESFPFNNFLPDPVPVANTIKDIANIMDYYAFYHKDAVTIKLGNDLKNKDYDQLLNEAYWQTISFVSVINFDRSWNTKEGTIYLDFIYSEDACAYSPSTTTTVPSCIPYTYYGGGNKISKNAAFPYEEDTNRPLLDVYNSDQLFFALQSGYNPQCIANSPAEKVLNKAKEILSNIIYDTMTENDKIVAIQSWLGSNVVYDNVSDDLFIYVNDIEHNPDEIAALTTSVYIEGALFNHAAVCHGYAKTESLLFNMLGINCTKVSNCYNSIDKSKQACSVAYTIENKTFLGAEYVSHGYNWVKDSEDNHYYLCDPTYDVNQAISDEDNHNTIRNMAIKMTYAVWHKLYTGCDYDWFATEHADELGTQPLLWQSYFKFEVEDQLYDLTFNSQTELRDRVIALQTYFSSYNDAAYLTGDKIFNVIFMPTLNHKNVFSSNYDEYYYIMMNIPYGINIIYDYCYPAYTYVLGFILVYDLSN